MATFHDRANRQALKDSLVDLGVAPDTGTSGDACFARVDTFYRWLPWSWTGRQIQPTRTKPCMLKAQRQIASAESNLSLIFCLMQWVQSNFVPIIEKRYRSILPRCRL
jgi:hypothetical protein